jgi:hypothetical protein
MQSLVKIKTSTQVVVERARFADDWVKPAKFGPDKEYDWLPVINEAEPAYNSATQKLQKAEVIENNQLINRYNIVALTQNELDVKDYLTQYETGFEVLPEGFFLRLGETDQEKFGQLLLLTSRLIANSMATTSTLTSIEDKDGVMQEVTLGRLEQILLMYGLKAKELWDLKPRDNALPI